MIFYNLYYINKLVTINTSINLNTPPDQEVYLNISYPLVIQLFYFLFIYFLYFIGMESHYAAQGGLKLLGLSDPSASAS